MCISDDRLSPHDESKVRMLYKRSVRNSTDPWKRAVYCILGACDPMDEHSEVATSLDDYLWIKLSQVYYIYKQLSTNPQTVTGKR